MKKIGILILAAALSSCSADKPTQMSSQSESRQIAIVIEKSAAVRLHPFVYSSRIIDADKGSKLEILDISAQKSPIAKANDYWYRVKMEDGITGWIYGTNIKIFSAGSSFSASSLEKQLLEDDRDEVSKKLVGKWWSVNIKDEFTSYSLSMFENGDYEAKHKDGDKVFKGKYTIDMESSLISFDGGTPLGNELKFSERGQSFFIEYADEKANYRFKQISMDPKSAQEIDTVNDSQSTDNNKPDPAVDNPPAE